MNDPPQSSRHYHKATAQRAAVPLLLNLLAVVALFSSHFSKRSPGRSSNAQSCLITIIFPFAFLIQPLNQFDSRQARDTCSFPVCPASRHRLRLSWGGGGDHSGNDTNYQQLSALRQVVRGCSSRHRLANTALLTLPACRRGRG